MRLRIEKERTPRGKDDLAIKTGKGGLMDAEFIAQTLCLENDWQEPNTLRALQKGRAAKVLPNADKLIENYLQLRRVEGILRRWSYEGETVLPDDPAPYYRVSVRCGFKSADEFRRALADYRREIRAAYRKGRIYRALSARMVVGLGRGLAGAGGADRETARRRAVIFSLALPGTTSFAVPE